jgi:Oxidoreductase FAD-binding domain
LITTSLRSSRSRCIHAIRPGRSWKGHRPGQYIRVGIDVDGVRHWRAYSLTSQSTSTDGLLSITVKAIPNGKVSNHNVRLSSPGTLVTSIRHRATLFCPDRCLLELGSRVVLLSPSSRPPGWWARRGPAVAKILENMEIGHNVMHGQWDWMRDPKIHSAAWEWDHASPADLWKRSHNELHHTHTNVLGLDNYLGYGIMRVDEDQRWVPMFLGQPLWNFINACFFEYAIAAYDLELGKQLKSRGPATGTPKSPRGSMRSAADTACRTHPGLFPARWAQLGNGSSSCRHPTTSRSATPPTGYCDVGPERRRCGGTEAQATVPTEPEGGPHADTEPPSPCLTLMIAITVRCGDTMDEKHGLGRVPGIV